ncbi:ribbon-helix-helix protein, CopG family [Thermoleptolyngbya oregonensis NK1-22]|uniref:Ribbon-helix-helix protein, CopG family n=1 Tax=Thermoleptolyngbya oregonensis NK1-22 TaxID=2547457 RepID=A0AA97BND3_9CYAN|nr:ribbon-helix-helix protein, CopG family [Thermoleptolyngbya oregonensis NK1-22]
MATSKAKVMAYIEPELKEDLERLADVRNRSISNLLETLIRDEIERAKSTGELKPPVQQGK